MRDPGQFNRRVSLLGVTRVPDGGGGYTETVAPIGEMWAKVEPLQGDEQVQAMQTGMRRPHRFVLPIRGGLDPVSVIEYRGRQFDVKSVVDTDAEHEELVLLADEVVP